MTKLLEEAFAKVSKFPESMQDAVAAIEIDELKDQQKWDTAFANSQKALSKLAVKVRDEIKNGETLPYDPASRHK